MKNNENKGETKKLYQKNSFCQQNSNNEDSYSEPEIIIKKRSRK